MDKKIIVIESLMPKGVEHRRIRWGFRLGIRVIESLMPKGVEHTLQAFHNDAAIEL